MARKPLLAVCAAAALAVSALVPTAQAAGPAPAKTPVTVGADRFIVTYTNGAKPVSDRMQVQNAKAEKHGKKVKASRILGTGAELVQLDSKLDAQAAAAFMDSLKSQPGVATVEIDRLLQPASVPTDPYYSTKQWDMKAGAGGMNVEPARDIATGKGIVVGVVDTGITSHPDLDANILPGYDMISDAGAARDGDGRDSDPSDMGDWMEATDRCNPYRVFQPSSFHGSHVAGTIAAIANNGIGIAGVAPDAKIVPVRVLGHCGGYTSDIIDGMLWAAGISVPGAPTNANPANVINLSLGGPGSCSYAQQQAVDKITAKGVTIVVAAGNNAKNASGFNPANCSGVITVASNGPTGDMSYFSNYGSTIEIMAPGGDMSKAQSDGILSTVSLGQRGPTTSGYSYMQGTSMAAPHVAGLAALLYQVKPDITPAQVLTAIQKTARPAECSKGCGSGIADAAAAVTYVTGGTTPTPSPTPTPTPDPTPTPTPTGNALANGDFENGRTGWSGTTEAIWNNSSYAHGGSWYAEMLGFGKSKTEYLEQRVTVPSNGTLSFYLRVGTDETTTSSQYDKLKVEVRTTYGSTVLKTLATYSNLDASSSYSLKTLDLSAYAGKTITLRFNASEDSMNATTFFIDDVVVR